MSTAWAVDDTALLAAINAAVPKGMEPEMRAEVCQELAVLVLTGDADIANLKSMLPEVKANFREMFDRRFKDVQLSAPVPGTDKIKVADTLVAAPQAWRFDVDIATEYLEAEAAEAAWRERNAPSPDVLSESTKAALLLVDRMGNGRWGTERIPLGRVKLVVEQRAVGAIAANIRPVAIYCAKTVGGYSLTEIETYFGMTRDQVRGALDKVSFLIAKSPEMAEGVRDLATHLRSDGQETGHRVSGGVAHAPARANTCLPIDGILCAVRAHREYTATAQFTNRQLAIYYAKLIGGYSQRELVRHFGIHLDTVKTALHGVADWLTTPERINAIHDLGMKIRAVEAPGNAVDSPVSDSQTVAHIRERMETQVSEAAPINPRTIGRLAGDWLADTRIESTREPSRPENLVRRTVSGQRRWPAREATEVMPVTPVSLAVAKERHDALVGNPITELGHRQIAVKEIGVAVLQRWGGSGEAPERDISSGSAPLRTHSISAKEMRDLVAPVGRATTDISNRKPIVARLRERVQANQNQLSARYGRASDETRREMGPQTRVNPEQEPTMTPAQTQYAAAKAAYDTERENPHGNDYPERQAAMQPIERAKFKAETELLADTAFRIASDPDLIAKYADLGNRAMHPSTRPMEAAALLEDAMRADLDGPERVTEVAESRSTIAEALAAERAEIARIAETGVVNRGEENGATNYLNGRVDGYNSMRDSLAATTNEQLPEAIQEGEMRLTLPAVERTKLEDLSIAAA